MTCIIYSLTPAITDKLLHIDSKICYWVAVVAAVHQDESHDALMGSDDR